MHDAPRFQPARRADDRLGLGISDAAGKLCRREAAKHHGMHGAKPRGRQHGNRRFRHHRHIDHHAVALGDAARGQGAGQLRHAVLQFGIADALNLPRHRAVIDDCILLPAPGSDMAIHRIVAGIQGRIGKPASVNAHRGIKNPLWCAIPINAPRGFRPIGFRVALPARMGRVILRGLGHGSPSYAAAPD